MCMKIVKKNKNPITNVDQYFDDVQTVEKIFHLYRGVELKITYLTVKDDTKGKFTNIVKPVMLEFFSTRGILNSTYDIPAHALYLNDGKFKTSESYNIFYSDKLERNGEFISAPNDQTISYDRVSNDRNSIFKIHRRNTTSRFTDGTGFGLQFFNNGNELRTSIAVKYFG